MSTPDPIAFPELTDAEIDLLRPRGEEVDLAPDEPLWKAGDTDFCFFVILSGGCIVRDSQEVGERVARHGPRGFTGDVDVLSGKPAPVGGYADGPTRALRLSAEALREVVRVEQDLGGKILSAFIRRRELLLATESHGVILVGSEYDPDTMRVREFLGRNRVVYRWRRVEDAETQGLIRAFGLRNQDFPFVLLGSTKLRNPETELLAQKLGVQKPNHGKTYDLVIIGAGPAGLAAAVYGASEGLSTLMLDRSAPGGQASWSSRIENYMGFPEGLSGSDLAARGLIQAQKFGAEVSIPCDVVGIDCGELGHAVRLSNGDEITARAVLVATGATYQRLNAPGFDQFERNGVYYSATRLEAGFCTDSEVVVVGAGNSAGQAAVYLSQSCRKVRLVVRGDQLNKSMSDYLSYRVEQIPNIEVHLETEVARVCGQERIEEVVLKGKTSETVPCAGLFVFIGARPNTDFLRGIIELDRNGFVLTGDAMRHAWDLGRMPYYLETSCPGVFAAGDCRVGNVKRVASSVGEGSMAVTFIHRYLSL